MGGRYVYFSFPFLPSLLSSTCNSRTYAISAAANKIRQIKNTVKTSQSIALAEKAVFSMEHVKRVLEVAEAFEDDMRGGKGYRDAMRQYT
jgi:hypothetical protein